MELKCKMFPVSLRQPHPVFLFRRLSHRLSLLTYAPLPSSITPPLCHSRLKTDTRFTNPSHHIDSFPHSGLIPWTITRRVRFVKFLLPGSDSEVEDQGAEGIVVLLERPRLHFWREFTARVAIFPVGVKPRRQMEPWSQGPFLLSYIGFYF